MEIVLDELITLQSALVNVKMFLSQERTIDPDELKKMVEEAYGIVMNKIDSRDPFDGYGGPVGRI
jgi:hypothetical protein